MANVKISGLPAAAALDGTELVPVVQAGVTSQTTTSGVAALASATPGGSTTQLQYNNAGSFGGITGATTDGTAVTLVAPVLGAATATSINKVALTAPATGSTLTIADGKTLTVSNSLTLAGTDSSSLDIGTGGTLGTAAFKATGTSGNTVPLLDGANTFSALNLFPSIGITQAYSGAGIYGTSGAYLQASGTLTDTTSTGTVATAYGGLLGDHTWAASAATTITASFGVYVKVPTAGTNVTLTQTYAIGTNGPIRIERAGLLSNPSIQLMGGSGQYSGLYTTVSNDTYYTSFSGGAFFGLLNSKGVGMSSDAAFGWSSGTTGDFPVTRLYRDADHIIAQRNGTNAQALRVYNTYTDASNNEYGSITWQTTANIMRIRSVANGTGTVRPIAIDGYTMAGAPTATQLPAGTWGVFKDSSGGGVVIAYNDGGTIKTAALT